jgi:hypothetical protein
LSGVDGLLIVDDRAIIVDHWVFMIGEPAVSFGISQSKFLAHLLSCVQLLLFACVWVHPRRFVCELAKICKTPPARIVAVAAIMLM